MTLSSRDHVFHPAVQRWFDRRFGSPTEPQRLAWPSIQSGRHTLIAAPTGSGKTLSAFLASIDRLVRQGLEEDLPDTTQILYVSPLKALSNDINKNLDEPLAGIRAELREMGLPDVPIRTLVRTGDTPASERAAMVRRNPHILVTTPESLYILLTSDNGRKMLRNVRSVIVDEIHAVADDRRGSHLALSLERLAALTPEPPVRIGLSATQSPIEEVARFLVGMGNVAPDGTPDCKIIDVGHRRKMDLAIEVPGSPLEAVMSGETWKEIYDRLATLIEEHRTTLIFVNTRRLAERMTRFLTERLGEDNVATHHGSLSREQRLESEQRLKTGRLKALVATASLELGIDIGDVDLVCQIASPRSIATFLQRIGRSGHSLRGVPKGHLFVLSRDDLVEAAALLDAVRRGELDRLEIPLEPLGILAQQIVAAVSAEEWLEEDLYAMVRRAYPYRNLSPADFEAIVKMLAEGFTTRRGRRAALLHRDAIGGRLRGRRGSRLLAITSGGAIPENADYRVIQDPTETFVGTLNEDFAIESSAGDIFQLGNTSWRILKVEQGRVRVEDAKGSPPTIPFWVGEAPSRTPELSLAVSRLRCEIDQRLSEGLAVSWLTDEVGIAEPAARQIVEYLAAGRAALGVMPTQETLVIERFFDEAGDMHVVLHSPYGSRLNRAWGLALRKRFCKKFNFELQAAATEDALILSLGPTHSFPLDDVFRYLNSKSVREILVQALLDAPMFPIRWRWNAGFALAIPRFRGGKKVPPRLQRMQAEDLIAVVFPDQLACFENIQGEREVPDHPLVKQTIRDCLEEYMDIERLEAILRSIEAGERTLVARDLTEASPLTHEILNARPYAFLDDAPLEERRTMAVQTRRWLSTDDAAELGQLDISAIERVRSEAWPEPENADELHDALMLLGYLTEEEGQAGKPPGPPPTVVSIDSATRRESRDWSEWFEELRTQGRATQLSVSGRATPLWVASERLPEIRRVWSDAVEDPQIALPAALDREWSPDHAVVEILRGRFEALGPTTVGAMASASGLSVSDIERVTLALESEGFILRGHFTPGVETTEYCERRLLARIHRYTLDRLRREIEPVTVADFTRFLLAWQHISAEDRMQGPDGLAAVLDQLEGMEAPAGAWEREILPARLENYDPLWLDSLCLSGRYVWSRVAAGQKAPRVGPVRRTPIALLRRDHLSAWTGPAPAPSGDVALSSGARALYDFLRKRGASFFGEMATGSGLLKTHVEEALGELVAWGLVSADSFAGLRALLVPSNKRPAIRGGRRRWGMANLGIENAGRWFPVHAEQPGVEGGDAGAVSTAPTRSMRSRDAAAPYPEDVETIAWVLLRRYGVVFRKLLDRENRAPAWRLLLEVYRRLEARGEVRGGRFVSGPSGEQYALPEAVARLRSLRRAGTPGALVSVSAADPLNLTGLILPGERVPNLTKNRILYRDGVPIAIFEAGAARFLEEMEPAEKWQAQEALLKRRVAPRLRAYLGRNA